MMFAFAGLFAASCSQAPEGEKVESKETKEVEKVEEAKTLNVDSASAVINWEGTKTGGGHKGTIALKSGSLQVKGNEVVGGSFIINMKSIACTDLKDKAKTDLEKHLKEKDFFEVEKFAEGKFEITSVKAEAGKDGATHRVEGNLTLKDKSHGVNIPATIKVENGEASISAPAFTINRQDWGINFKIPTKDVILNDQIGLKLSLKAK